MMSKTIVGAGVATGAVVAVTGLALGSASGHAESGGSEPRGSEAYGVEAEGAVSIAKTPYASSDDGSTKTGGQVVSLGEFGEVSVGKVIAGDNKASVQLIGLELANDTGTVTADVIKASCRGEKGFVEVVNLNVNGTPVVVPPRDQNRTNEEVDAAPVAKVTYNMQHRNSDGSFTVTGLEIQLLDETEIIRLGSVTCAEAASLPTNPKMANPPTPITTGLPVTG